MSKYITLTVAKVNIPSIRFNKRRGLNLAFLNSWNFKITMVGLIILLGLFYIVEINNLSTQGFKIKDLEAKINQLKAENQALELQAAELQSSNKLQSRIEELNMTTVAKVEYLSPTAEMVARK